jgi:hypothetical protein
MKGNIQKMLSCIGQEAADLAKAINGVKSFLDAQADPEKTWDQDETLAAFGDIRTQDQLEAACLRLDELMGRHRDLTQAMKATDERLADLNIEFRATLEAHEITDVLLEDADRLLPEKTPAEAAGVTPSQPPTAPEKNLTASTAATDMVAVPTALCPPQTSQLWLRAEGIILRDTVRNGKIEQALDSCSQGRLGPIDAATSERILNRAPEGLRFTFCNTSMDIELEALCGVIHNKNIRGLSDKTYRKRIRKELAAWILYSLRDPSLAIAVSETDTVEEILRLVRFRLRQANVCLSASRV